ncbi:ATP-dependent DNA helicase [Enhydrobacter sp.]|jgi:ATP-dependent DNA helicase DinG|uniref:ATP-dependent DNA helicase n=1 Tax=Enhydrobacter sp. TaxID=1894999 RepID=UPI0026232483|nr:ATP-dependent DNA helicase [Enhydrobacter sp.]WIM11805.1 MAG: DinG family ATP-dependent helicase YoaA [Enhydrobacter sp.]
MSLPPSWPALVATARGALWLSADGEIERIAVAEAVSRAAGAFPLVCHGPATAARLGSDALAVRDLLELYAFVRPARFCLPTVRGLCEALDLPLPATLEDALARLPDAARALLFELEDMAALASADLKDTALVMARGNWPWGKEVLAALGLDADAAKKPRLGAGLDVWKSLPAWEEPPPATPPGSLPVEPREARLRLAQLVAAGPNMAEARPTQSDYASAASEAFAPREEEEKPKVVLVEAGTGVGKTLGYVAPASLWAEKNGAPVWIATYTRNLQRQIDGELDRLHRDSAEKRRRVVIRKGRENYLCLLNFQEAVLRTGLVPENAVGLGLLARWALASRDGDMIGGDLPAWLIDLVGRNRVGRLADRRGECIYSACEHYRKCFVERTIRRARQADIVIANHALVMVQAVMGGLDDATRPLRYVFDEGHHLFDAADGAFGAHLSGVEGSDLRRWILGAEGRRGSRARGLERRVQDLLGEDQEAQNALRRLLDLARRLPAPNWQTRLADGTVLGPAEEFLALVRQQVRARAAGDDQGFGLECDIRPLNPGLIEAADAVASLFEQMLVPVRRLRATLRAKLEAEADKLDSGQRGRIEGVARSLANRCELTLEAWRAMLRGLHGDTDPAFVDWFAIERSQNREIDVGMYRHYLDPTEPFVNAVIKPAHGAVITSATLRDSLGLPAPANDDVERTAGFQHAHERAGSPRSSEAPADWFAAEARTGTRHLLAPAMRAAMASPFDYARSTRVLIVRDVRRDDAEQVAAAYRELFLAAGGGALGLFTAIGRLRATHQRIAAALEEAGLPLYAQHVGGMDAATLVDIFRAEEQSCLLGTDAVRDGVDVPGRSLRLIVFDRVPWPRPDILHRARKAAWKAAGAGANAYDDMLARLRLKQAYGRLIRRADDRGVFVMLDSRLPSRLLGAFPPGVPVERLGLAEAVTAVRAFLHQP